MKKAWAMRCDGFGRHGYCLNQKADGTTGGRLSVRLWVRAAMSFYEAHDFLYVDSFVDGLSLSYLYSGFLFLGLKDASSALMIGRRDLGMVLLGSYLSDKSWA